MEGGRPPLLDVNSWKPPIQVIINAADGSTVSAPLVSGSTIGGGVSNSTVRERVLHRRANSELHSAGPAPKRARVDEVHGYVHYVSQLKPMSRRASKEQMYFTARLQRRSDHVRVVIFDQKSYSAFCAAQNERVPVSLKSIHFPESQQQVTFNQNSWLSRMQSLDFEHDSKSCEPKLVGSVLEAKQSLKGEWITITGNITEQRTQRDPYHKGNRQPIKYSLADRSASIILTLWEDKWHINPGAWYTISHVEVEQYRGRNQLNFTQYTKLTEEPAQGDVVDLSRHKFKVLGASVKNCHQCHICKEELSFVGLNQISVQCPVCKNRVLTQSIIHLTKAKITVQKVGGTAIFSIPQSCIKPLLDLERPGFCDTEQAENKLLQMKMVEVVFRFNEVVEIKEATEEGYQD